MPRYSSSNSGSSATNAISENSVVYSSAGGHSHDGQGSSLIDTTKYSVWDFSVNTVYSTNPRATRQATHIEQFKNFIVNVVNTSVLEPAGITLGDNVINANNIVAGSINSELIAANTIVAGNIAANTITTDLLATDALTSSNYAYTSGNFSDAGTFIDLSDGSITSEQFYIDNSGNAGFKGSINLGTYNYWNSNGTFSVGDANSGMTWDGTSLFLTGNLDLSTNNYWYKDGDFKVGGVSEYLFWNQAAATLTVRGDLSLDTNNYWYRGGDFKVGDASTYMFWDQSAATLTVSGSVVAGDVKAGKAADGTNPGISLGTVDGSSNYWIRTSGGDVKLFAGVLSDQSYISIDTASAGNNIIVLSGSYTSGGGGTVDVATSMGGQYGIMGSYATGVTYYNQSYNYDWDSILYGPKIEVSNGDLSSQPTAMMGNDDHEYPTTISGAGQHAFFKTRILVSGNEKVTTKMGTQNGGTIIVGDTSNGTASLKFEANGNDLIISNALGNANIQLYGQNGYIRAQNTMYRTPAGPTKYVVTDGNGNFFGNTTSYGSSITIKRDIEPIPYGLDTIMQIRPIRFEYIDSESGKKNIGMIAEELMHVLPEACVFDLEDPDFQPSIGYQDIVPVLVKGIQELKSKIDDLENQIASLS